MGNDSYASSRLDPDRLPEDLRTASVVGEFSR